MHDDTVPIPKGLWAETLLTTCLLVNLENLVTILTLKLLDVMFMHMLSKGNYLQEL